MLLESRIDERTTLVIDAETVGGIEKGGLTVHGVPDRILPRTIEVVRALATQLGSAVEEGPAAPSEVDITFSVRVDSNSTVSVCRNPNDGQFRVSLRWRR